eukprot:3408880-Amphidinium_carterae.1
MLMDPYVLQAIWRHMNAAEPQDHFSSKKIAMRHKATDSFFHAVADGGALLVTFVEQKPLI